MCARATQSLGHLCCTTVITFLQKCIFRLVTNKSYHHQIYTINGSYAAHICRLSLIVSPPSLLPTVLQPMLHIM